jgi:predicted Zn-dependent protease
VIGEIGENDLLGPANSARYAGSPARARQALLKLRDRFPGRPAADLAALYLARIAEQSEHRPQEAVRWLRTFLSESPTGDLAQSARASLLSILSAQGDTAGARAVAEDYLRYHPEGPLAEQARSLVSRTTPP